MPARSDDPLRRVTLNLYVSDCEILERAFGQGWTASVREAAHRLANEHRKPRTLGMSRTLGDLE